MSKLSTEEVLAFLGQAFQRLIVVEFVGRKRGKVVYRCRCNCGRFVEVIRGNLVSGNSKSCGCLIQDVAAASAHKHVKHGMSRSPEYKAWEAARRRCTDTSCPEFSDYEGRGITFSLAWLNNPETFLADMGSKPSSLHELDRIKNNEGYSKANCRWATKKTNNRNKRNNVLLAYQGETMPVSAFCEKVDLPQHLALHRAHKGMSGEQILKELA